MIGWLRRALTDRDGEPDTGRILSPMVIGTMCFMAIAHPESYNAQTFGTGIAGVLAGLAAYLWGDSRRPPP